MVGRPAEPSDTIAIPVRALLRAAVTLGLAAAVLLAAWAVVPAILARSVSAQIDRDAYQAVFLIGGQVYFGKLATRGDDYFLLSDVYYLSPTDALPSPGPSPRPGQLIKRGSEIHGPQDVMVIPAANVLFFENLRADGEVMTAIRRFKSGEIPPATAAPAPVQTPRPSPSPTR